MSTGADAATGSLESIHWAAVALAAFSGLVHLALGVMSLGDRLGVPFIIAGVGFGLGIALFLRGYRRRLLYLIGILFVAGQIVLYFALNWPNVVSPLGLADKVAQAALVIVLVLLYQRES